MVEWPKFPRSNGNRGRGTRWWRQSLDRKWKYGRFAHAQCAMKNTQYNAHLWPNRRNFRVLKEIGVEEHDSDVRFWTGSGNIALSFMRHASSHNYRNSSFIVDVAMGQIPRSTERISSLVMKTLTIMHFFSYMSQLLGGTHMNYINITTFSNVRACFSQRRSLISGIKYLLLLLISRVCLPLRKQLAILVSQNL